MRCVCLIVLALAGCPDGRRNVEPDAFVANVDAELPSGYDEWTRICAKHYGDAISTKFCAGPLPPKLSSLVELEELLELRNRSETGLVMTGHSTGVGLRSVTSLNPRAIVFRGPATSASLGNRTTVLAFARGETFVELVGNDPDAQTLRFFLIRFRLPCEDTATGCNSADLLTPTIEAGWQSYTLSDETALAGTTLDCLVCHQPDGPGTPKILRMQELLSPWTHWFSQFGDRTFEQMHAGEDYAGFPVGGMMSSPGGLQFLVTSSGFGSQPNAFVSQVIDDELRATGASPTWEGIYNNAVTGLAIPPPYFGADQTDAAKRANMIARYAEVMAGTLSRDQLPDIRDVMLDSALPAMSIRPKAGLDGRGILVHMCSQCHNSRLDQALSRARFNAMTLDAMSRQEKDKAVARLMLPDTDPAKMPPVRFRILSPEERSLAIDFLAQ